MLAPEPHGLQALEALQVPRKLPSKKLPFDGGALLRDSRERFRGELPQALEPPPRPRRLLASLVVALVELAQLAAARRTPAPARSSEEVTHPLCWGR